MRQGGFCPWRTSAPNSEYHFRGGWVIDMVKAGAAEALAVPPVFALRSHNARRNGRSGGAK